MGLDSLSSSISSVISDYQTSTLVLLTLVVILGHYYYSYKFGYFKRLGLKNPPAWPVVGNILTIFSTDRMMLETEWARTYGKLYGVFHGWKPIFVVADAEVLRQICIKDFDAMPNHERSELLNEYQKSFLFFMQDEHWKRVRALQSPTFTSGKIRRMYKLLDKCADDLLQCFEERLEGKLDKKSVVNLKEIYSLYTLDAIASCGYGLKLERNGTSSIKSAAKRNDFAAMIVRIFEFDLLRVFVGMTLPTSLLKSIGFTVGPRKNYVEIASKVRHIFDSRRVSGKKFDDYLQILVDAKLDDKMELDEMDDEENHHASLTRATLQEDQEKMIKDINEGNTGANGSTTMANGHDKSNGTTSPTVNTKVSLEDYEIISSAIFLLMVGVETTATLLTNCSYALAFHQDIQERLYETVKSIAQVDSATGEWKFDYDSLTACPYLDSVISETLRALAPVIQLDRKTNRDYHIEKYNVTVKKGQQILLAYYAIMNNPEYWPEPHKFDPDRFMPENRDKIVPGSYCPFGLGPRHCLGMRFSLTEAKLALARVLMKYKFVPAPGTSYPPVTRMRVGLNAITTPQATLMLR